MIKINSAKHILIVDDESDIRRLIRGILEDEGYQVTEAENSKQAFTLFDEKKPDLAVLDIWLQGSDKDGLEILERFKSVNPTFPVLMISGHGNIEMAVNAIKNGAYDFIEKPFKSDRLLLMIGRGLENAKLKTENSSLKEFQSLTYDLLLALSPQMRDFYTRLDLLSQSSKALLIEGSDENVKFKVIKFLKKRDMELGKKQERVIATSTAELNNMDYEVLELPNSFSKSKNDDDSFDSPLREARDNFEKNYLLYQIERFNGNISQTATFVGMERSALHRKLKSLDISLNGAQNNEKSLKQQTG